MDTFVGRLNIEHYRELLAAECDHEKRQFISRLLVEEEAKLAALQRPSVPAADAHPPATANDGVSHLNLEYYRKRLATETSAVMQGILTRLIVDEEARLAPLRARKISGDD